MGLFYQAYRYKERTKTQNCKSNDKKTSEKFNNCINKQKKQNVQIIVLVNMKMCVKLRSKMFSSRIDRNELIFGIWRVLNGSKMEK